MRKGILLLCIAFSSLYLSAQTTFKSGFITYQTTGEKSVEVSKADEEDADKNKIKEYEIPATVENEGVTYTVTAIGSNVFYYSDLENITLPETIEKIGYQAFKSTPNLKSITLPSSLKLIDGYAFNSSAITSIVIPDAVKEIGDNAFFTCNSLESVTLNEGLEKMGKSVFYKCPITSIVLPNSLESISGGLFYGCAKLSSVTMSDKVNYIGERAFRECTSLTSLSLPSGIKTIGEDAFLKCTAMTSFTLPAGVETLGANFVANSGITSLSVEDGNENFHAVGNVIYSKDNTILYAAPTKGMTELEVDKKCVGIFGGAFSGSDIKRITLPEGLRAIDDFAFCESALETISFPSSVVYIGEQAFAGTQLTDVTLPENMPSVINSSFAGCPKLKSITIPSGVTFIGNMAFRASSNVEKITCLGSNAPKLEDVYEAYDSPFYGMSQSTPLYVPKGCAESYRSAGYSEFLTITESDKGVFGYVSTTPSQNGTLEAGWQDMTFDVVFDEAVTIVESAPKAYLRTEDMLTGGTVTPDEWIAAKGDDDKTLRVFGVDADRYNYTYKVTEGTVYYMIIPAGTVKNAAGELNEQIVITYTGTVASGIDKVTGGESEEVARYNINGQRISSQKGINIIKMSDGTVRKVLSR